MAQPQRLQVAGLGDSAEHAMLAQRLAEARVGGNFWNVPHSKTARAGVSDGHADLDPWSLIEAQDVLLAPADSDLALLAAAAGKAVYAPGATTPLRREPLLEALHQRVAQYAYFDPWSGRPIDIGRWIEILGEWRRLLDANRGIALVCGIARWKRPAIAGFLWSGRQVGFAKAGKPQTEEAIAVWPSRVAESVQRAARARSQGLVQIEDGFVRSAGLGSRLHPPFSIVADGRGIYYDPGQPSDLEQILAHHELGTELCARAERLMRVILARGITKYAAASGAKVTLPSGVRTVLVPGQVSDDRSVRLGCAGIEGQLDLLQRVRAAEPQAFIVYKPHPDVVAGLRKGHVPPSEARRYVDLVLADAPIDPLLRAVDAVHVLTSLTGFEALLRGRAVVTHGQPFYAGWGLTRDLAPPIMRRGRQLSLAQLVAGTLILYPRYLDPLTRLPCPPEVLVERLSRGEVPRPGLLQQLRRLQGALANSGRQLAGARA